MVQEYRKIVRDKIAPGGPADRKNASREKGYAIPFQDLSSSLCRQDSHNKKTKQVLLPQRTLRIDFSIPGERYLHIAKRPLAARKNRQQKRMRGFQFCA